MGVGQNGRPRGPQMEMSSLVLTIQLLGYLILTHTQIIHLNRIFPYKPSSYWGYPMETHTVKTLPQETNDKSFETSSGFDDKDEVRARAGSNHRELTEHRCGQPIKKGVI